LGEAAKVASIDKLSIVFVLVLAAFFLKERLDRFSILGIALIIGGALLLARPR
jgi:transporter family protein